VPTYEYACRACGHSFDTVQSFSDAALTECPECGGSLRKVFSPVGIVFRGSGFYRTDSRSGAGRNAGDVAANGSKPDGGKSKSESAAGKGESAGSGSGGKTDSAGKTSDKPADKGTSGVPAKAS
jgi:putative FmdB family regulatory protein